MALDMTELFTPGARVAFTGTISHHDQVWATDEELAALCAELELEYTPAVAKNACDVLVAGEAAHTSRKAQAAQEHDIPIVSAQEFAAWSQERVGVPPAEVTATGSPIHPAVDVLGAGTRVAFRGSVHVAGERYPHGEALQELCTDLDLEYKSSVSKGSSDVLVSDDPAATDRKAQLAAAYEKPTVLADDFDQWAQDQLADPRDSEPEPAEEPVPEVEEISTEPLIDPAVPLVEQVAADPEPAAPEPVIAEPLPAVLPVEEPEEEPAPAPTPAPAPAATVERVLPARTPARVTQRQDAVTVLLLIFSGLALTWGVVAAFRWLRRRFRGN